jgi:tol-pal system protein YbgF
MDVHRSIIPLLGLALVSGCAHTGEAAGDGADSSEVTDLRERVGRLERRISDMDARLALLTERLSSGGGSAEVSLGSPTPSYAPPPASAWSEPAPPAYSAPYGEGSYDPGYSEPAPAPAPSYGPGTRAVDLGEHAPRSTYNPPPDPAPAPAPSPAASAPTPSGASGDGVPGGSPQAIYDWARARMKEGRYEEAIAGYQQVLAGHPKHHLADNALYWTAVSHAERGEHKVAISAWKQLPLRFPDSPKMPDSLYGMALSHEQLGEPVLAEALYSQLAEQYPKADKAKEAKRALRRLGGAP